MLYQPLLLSLLVHVVDACGDGPPSARVPCGPSACQDSPIGDICPGQECGYHNATNPKIRAPNYHVMGTTCAENDPNGPFYDEKFGMYHLFYQVVHAACRFA